MRGILSFGWSVIERVQDNSLAQAFYRFAMDLKDGLKRRFEFAGSGLFIHLPFTSRSLWVEWREQSVGFGIDRTEPGNTEFFAGRIQGVLSVEGGR